MPCIRKRIDRPVSSDLTERFKIMAKKNIIFEKSGGRRIPLYAEVGKYFFPDGSFDEDQFRRSLRTLLELLKEQTEERDFSRVAGEWLSSYLVEIIDYLDEKGMPDASFKLLKAAVEESADMGIKEISLPPFHLENVLSGVSVVPVNKEVKKDSLEKKKSQIFEAALQVFAKDGYHKATIDKVAALSGVGKGSIYRYFKSKEDLFEQLLINKYREIVERVSEIFSRENNILKQIQEAVEFWVTFIAENHVVYSLIQSEALMKRSGRSDMFFDYLISHLPLIKERIVALNREKKLKTTSFYTVFYGILGFIDGVIQKWFRCGMDYDLRDEIPVILEVLFNGFVGENTTKGAFFIPPESEKSQ